MKASYDELIKKLKSAANPKNVEGMARFGINPENTLGVSIPFLRNLAKEIKKSSGKNTAGNHKLAQELWSSKIHEARILASMVDDPKLVTEKQMDSWVKDFDSWDVCDQVCMNLFWQAPYAHKKTIEWCSREQEFERRAGFAMIAVLAFKDKDVKDAEFDKFFPLIKKYSIDERNFVKKAVNWALRQIGKRNPALNKRALKIASEIQKLNSKPAKWIANDAIKELNLKTSF